MTEVIIAAATASMLAVWMERLFGPTNPWGFTVAWLLVVMGCVLYREFA